MTNSKRDTVIRFRAESELKKRLSTAASNNRKRPAEFLREKLWALVTSEEVTAGKGRRR